MSECAPSDVSNGVRSRLLQRARDLPLGMLSVGDVPARAERKGTDGGPEATAPGLWNLEASADRRGAYPVPDRPESGLGESPSADQSSGEAASEHPQDGDALTGHRRYRPSAWERPNLHPIEAVRHTWRHTCPCMLVLGAVHHSSHVQALFDG